jgi:integrase/recombinase XerC
VRPEISDHAAWLLKQDKASTTINAYGRRNRALAEWLEARGATLLTATPDLMLEWRTSLTVSPNSVLTYLAAVRSFYRWAMWAGKATSDPTADLPVPKWRKGRPRPIAEPALVSAILNAPVRIRPWLILAALAGLRACEIAGLRRDDILDGPRVMIIRGKGRKERVVPISAQVWAELLKAGMPSSGWMFPRYDGKPGPNTAHKVSDLTNAFLRSIGIRETLHQLRHRFGTQSYAATRDLRIVQELMGHQDPATTALYCDFSRAESISTVDAVQIDLSQPDGGQLARDATRRQIDRTPHRPVRPGVLQGKSPIPLRAGEFPEGALQLAVENRTTHDHPVRKARHAPTRVSIVERKESVLTMKIPYGLVQFPLSHVAKASQVTRPTIPSTRSP